jgi:hypothetical protein
VLQLLHLARVTSADCSCSDVSLACLLDDRKLIRPNKKYFCFLVPPVPKIFYGTLEESWGDISWGGEQKMHSEQMCVGRRLRLMRGSTPDRMEWRRWIVGDRLTRAEHVKMHVKR